MKISDDDSDAFASFTDENFIMLVSMLEVVAENGTEWEDIMYLCFLGAAVSASNAEMTPDDFMVALRSIRVTEEGYSGDA